MKKSAAKIWVALCVAAPAIAFVLIHPVLEMGFDDDWAYARMARFLLDKGHIDYFLMIAPMTIPHTYWGALIIKVFGFSFFALRVSTLPFWCASGLLVYLFARRMHLPPSLSSLASLSYTLSPLAVHVGPTFMTDIPAIVLVLGTAYAALEAASAPVRRACFCLVAAALVGFIAGLDRDILMLAPCAMILSVALLRWSDRAVRAVGIGLAALVAVSAAGAIKWHYSLPGALKQPALLPPNILHAIPEDLRGFGYLVGTALLVSLPVVFALIMRVVAMRGRARLIVAILVIILSLAVIVKPNLAKPPWMMSQGDRVTIYGATIPDDLLRGDLPVLLPYSVRLALGVSVLIGAACFIGAASTMIRPMREFLRAPAGQRDQFLLFVATTAMFIALYLGFLATRFTVQVVFDRYLLPVLPLLVLYVAGLTFRLDPLRPSWVSWLVLAVVAAYGIAVNHDLYAAHRATLASVSALMNTGTPRDCITGGVEFDGWTQLEEKGALSQATFNAFPDRPFWQFTDAITPCYYIVTSLQTELGPVERTMSYDAWLPPHQRTVLTQRVSNACTARCFR